MGDECIGAGFCLHQFRNKEFVDKRGNAQRIQPCSFLCMPLACRACGRFVPEFVILAFGKCDFCRLRGTEPNGTYDHKRYHTQDRWTAPDASTQCW